MVKSSKSRCQSWKRVPIVQICVGQRFANLLWTVLQNTITPCVQGILLMTKYVSSTKRIPSGWFAWSSQPSPHLADPGQVGLGQTRRWELFANIIVNRNMFHKCFEVFGSWFIFAPQSEPLFSMLFQTSAKCRDCQVSREYRSSSLHLLQLLKILQPGHLAARLKWRRKILKICCNLLLSVDIAECFFLERAST